MESSELPRCASPPSWLLDGRDTDPPPPNKCRNRLILVLVSFTVAGLAAFFVDWELEKDGGGGDPSPSPPIPPPPWAGPYVCKSSLDFGSVEQGRHKGISLDDTTFEWCADSIPSSWPNTNRPLTSFRLFKAWDRTWLESLRPHAWGQLQAMVNATSSQVLVGTQITCDEQDDDRDWKLVLLLLKLLGPQHVLGVAIGNEMELIQFKRDISHSCVRDTWQGGYFWRKTVQRASDLSKLPGFEQVTLTTVFGGYALGGNPFAENAGALCNSYLKNATEMFGNRWAFTWNVYPYFDPGNRMDENNTHKCDDALRRSLCFDEDSCILIATITSARRKMEQLTGNDDDRMWLGETGWSWPQADSLAGSNPEIARCKDFSSEESFRTYYKNFLKWDLSIGDDLNGPEQVFYFAIHDANNFGVSEHFGLIGTCTTNDCKLQSHGGTATTSTITSTTNRHHRNTTTRTTRTTTSRTRTATTTTDDDEGQIAIV